MVIVSVAVSFVFDTLFPIAILIGVITAFLAVVIVALIRMKFDDFLAKVDADRGDKVGGEIVVDEPLEHRSLPDSGVTERQELDEEIVISSSPHFAHGRTSQAAALDVIVSAAVSTHRPEGKGGRGGGYGEQNGMFGSGRRR